MLSQRAHLAQHPKLPLVAAGRCLQDGEIFSSCLFPVLHLLTVSFLFVFLIQHDKLSIFRNSKILLQNRNHHLKDHNFLSCLPLAFFLSIYCCMFTYTERCFFRLYISHTCESLFFFQCSVHHPRMHADRFSYIFNNKMKVVHVEIPWCHPSTISKCHNL